MSEKQNEFKTDIEALKNTPFCSHCRNNKKASKPFSEMKKIELTPLAIKALEHTSKKFSIKEDCLICLSVKTFLDMPWNQQLELLKGKN
jgi:hypothetical protein